MSTKKKYSRFKKFLLTIAILIIAFFAYVEIANINSKHMTYRQKVLKAVYPAFMWWNKITGKNRKTMTNDIQPPVSFYTLTGTAINGATIDFSQYKGKKILLVNTASDCGYTGQYEGLERLYKQYGDKVVVIGFPANDFKEQEKGDNDAIAEFCKVNYGVTFPLMQKSTVIKGADQNPIFKWLTDPKQNGWNDQEPTWNFCKYLVDENGKLINFFASSVEPLSDEVISTLKK